MACSVTRFRWLHALGAVALLCGLGGCYRADFHQPAQRVIRNSAHSLPANTWNPSFGLAGTGSLDLGVNLGLAYSITDTTQVSTNLAHAGIGMLNLGVQQGIVVRERWALAAAAAVSWAHFQWFWFLPESARASVADIDLLTIPLSVLGTVSPVDWLETTLEVRYTHTELFGGVSGEAGLASGTLGGRAFDLLPTVRGFLWGRAALSATVRLPLWAAIPLESTVVSEVEPGAVLTAQTAAWVRVPFEKLWSLQVDAEFPVTEHFRVAVGIVNGPLSRAVLKWPVLPALRMDWRF